MVVYKSDSWKKASVFNPLTGDVALMTTLIGGETFLAPQEEITQQTTNGNYVSQWRHRVQFACSDWDAFDTLQGFKDGHIKVQAVAAAESLNCANLQWYESVKIKELRKVPKPRRADGDSHFIVVLEHEGDENAAIFNNVNLLHQTNVNGVVVNGFVDNDGDDLADGWTTTANYKDFTAGVQTIGRTGSTASVSFELTGIIFPIPNLDLTYSDEWTEEGFSSVQRVTQRDFSGTSLGTKENSANTNRNDIPISTATTFYSWDYVGPRLNTADAGENVKIKEVCIRTDGSKEYIAG